ncbi:MAG: pantetheine-phosphate adenylyltransferase [bacterium]|nr:pantetheine-phosphate adenylyltransferase [Myxococcales bacterium]MCB9552295.1 pantetheine-phosphate adenylyltransferase [Myxococcales bacterium]
MRVALYPGSFDPITAGHVDIIRRGLEIFDRIEIAVAVNIRKTPTFPDDERIEMLREVFAGEPRVEVVQFSGLLIDYARKRGIRSVLRGLRAISDFEYEFQMASMNRRLTDAVDFVFLMTSEEHYFVSSSLVREVAMNGGDVTGLVPESVARRLAARFADAAG